MCPHCSIVENLINCYEIHGFERTGEFCETKESVVDDNFFYKLKNKYSIYYIEYQFLSTFENLIFFKNKIAETKYNVNIINESIFRENAKSEKVISEGTIGVHVYEEKDKLLSEKKSIIEKFKAEEQKASSQ